MSHSRRVVTCIVATAALSAASVIPAVGSESAAAQWDRRIQPIATQVEGLRSLQFKEAVPVEFLSEPEFRKEVSVRRTLSKREKQDLALSERQFRAIGLIAGDVDLLSALESFRTSGTLAFYDPRAKRVTVRGTEIDASMRVTLVHELTHALQDQHFDLVRLQRRAERDHSTDALRALVEGDAVRVQRLYEAKLSTPEREEYEQARAATSKSASDEISAQGVPDWITTVFQVPYVLGPPMLALVMHERDEEGVDELFDHPPASDASYLNPATVLDGAEPTRVSPPKIAAGEQVLDKPDRFGSLAFYLMLAARGDPGLALDVSDRLAGDSMVTFRSGNTTCVRAVFVGRSDSATAALEAAIAGWAASMPGGTATSSRSTDGVTLTACDPGASAIGPPNSAAAALLVPALRGEVLAQAVAGGLPLEVARCMTTRLVRDSVIAPFVAEATVDQRGAPDGDAVKALQAKAVELATACLTQ